MKIPSILHFTWQGCEYTFDPRTRMIGGHMEYHVGHASRELQNFLASAFAPY